MAERSPKLEELDHLARLLDSRFRLPGTNIRFGWDSILGLVPGLGDTVTALPAAYLIYKGHQMGARRRTLGRMAVNAGIDFVIGGIPIVGDIFDVGFKANRRNVALLRKDVERAEAASAQDPAVIARRRSAAAPMRQS